MNEKPSQLILKKIFDESGIAYFENDIRLLLEEVIKELYCSDYELILRLRLPHIDRAIFKFRQANEKTNIKNTKQYFKACLTSAVKETAFEILEFSD